MADLPTPILIATMISLPLALAFFVSALRHGFRIEQRRNEQGK